MRISPWLKLLLAGAFIGLPSFVRAQAVTLSVQVAIDKASSQRMSYANQGLFFVKARVSNTGADDANIVTWTQSGWSWVSDNPAVVPNIAALQNASTATTLKPGDVYTYEVDLLCSSQTEGPITFRLGFVPDAKLPVSTTVPGIAKSNRVIWSNAVTLRHGCPTIHSSGRKPATRARAG